MKTEKKKKDTRLFWDSQVNSRAVLLGTASLSKCFITLSQE